MCLGFVGRLGLEGGERLGFYKAGFYKRVLCECMLRQFRFYQLVISRITFGMCLTFHGHVEVGIHVASFRATANLRLPRSVNSVTSTAQSKT